MVDGHAAAVPYISDVAFKVEPSNKGPVLRRYGDQVGAVATTPNNVAGGNTHRRDSDSRGLAQR
jgi:hypothetical protein